MNINNDLEVVFHKVATRSTSKARAYISAYWRGYRGVAKIDYMEFINTIINRVNNTNKDIDEKAQINAYHTAIYHLKHFMDMDIYKCDHVRYFAQVVTEELMKKTHNTARLIQLYSGDMGLIVQYLGADLC